MAEAEATGKHLLIDVTGEQCPPCREMDRTTWRAAEVEAWVAQHAVAVQVDQTENGVSGLGVMAVPTLVLMKDGREVDRTVGGRGAGALLRWLDGALEGRTELDQLRAVEPGDVSGRMKLARELVHRARFSEALPELQWLWEHAVEVQPSWVGVRYSFLLHELSVLVSNDEAAWRVFGRLRDEAEVGQGEAARDDFLALNEVLGDPDRTLTWWERVRSRPPPGLERNHQLVSLLEEKGLWADLGALITQPLVELRHEHQLTRESLEAPPDVPQESLEQLKQFIQESFRERAVALWRAMRAAGREPEAVAVAAEARRLDASDEMEEALSGAGA